jgi:aspartyl-tRNA(Asn)/glutamyl-tRNA(Gln) amidotransferase subunit C
VSRKIDHRLIRHIANLARISLGEEEVDSFAHQFARIVEYFDKLNQLDTEGVEPLTHAVELTNALAEDVATPSLTTDQALANAPDREGSFFKVPKVLGDS